MPWVTIANDMAYSIRPNQTASSTSTSLPTRRDVLKVSAASLAAAALPGWAAPSPRPDSKRILVGSGTPDGILAFGWDAATGTLTPQGIAAVISHSTWLGLSPDLRYLYVACELDEFNGQPTGSVASFKLEDGKLTPLSAVGSMGKGTCHLTTDHTGHVVICVNYSGGSASTFVVNNGKLSESVWSEHYQGHGPVSDRQEAAHAHFASVSPDNRFVYINDLGTDQIHIYKLDSATGKLLGAGKWASHAGAGPRTLHFAIGGPIAGKVAYCVNELDATVNVLGWDAADGSLHTLQQVKLLPENATAGNTGCDAVLTRDGRFAYFANRGQDFLMGFHIDPATGRLTPFEASPRTSTGGKIPRNFTLDPTERWMLVADQKSSNLAVFARDPKTGKLANEGKTFAAATPMCIVFV